MGMTLEYIKIKDLRPDPDNVRSKIEPAGIKELALSIGEIGVQVPLSVRKNGRGYIIRAGHRRLAALNTLIDKGLVKTTDTVPCLLTDGEFDEETNVVHQLVENLQREDLSPVDEARAMLRLVGFGMSNRDLAKAIGRSTKHVTGRLELAALPDKVAKAIEKGDVSLEQGSVLAQVQAAGVEIDDSMIRSPWKAKEALAAVETERTIAELTERYTGLGVTVIEEGHAAFEYLRSGEDQPEGGTHVAFAVGYSGPVVKWYREPDPAEVEAETEAQAKERAKAKAQRAKEREVTDHRKAFLQGWVAKPKKADVISLLIEQAAGEEAGYYNWARETCQVLGIEPHIREVPTNTGARKEKDWQGPLRTFLADASPADQLRAAAAFLAVRHEQGVLEHLGYEVPEG